MFSEQQHADYIMYIAFSSNSKYLATASADETIKIWSLHDSGNLIHTLSGHSYYVESIAITEDS